MKKTILVFIESHKDELCLNSYELMRKAREIAEISGMKIVAAVFSSGIGTCAEAAACLRADKLIVSEGPQFDSVNSRPYSETLNRIISEEDAAIVMIAASELGREIGAGAADNVKLLGTCHRVAAEEAGISAYICTENPDVMLRYDLSENERYVLMIEPVVIKGIVSERCSRAVVEEIRPASDADTEGFRILSEEKGEYAAELDASPIVVAGGRGMGNKEIFDSLYIIAGALGGAVGASRAAVFHEMADESQMIGISGRTVMPKLYIACGISGAMQHTESMEKSEYVLSINSNSTAPINDIADLSVTADARSLIPKLAEEIAKRAGVNT